MLFQVNSFIRGEKMRKSFFVLLVFLFVIFFFSGCDNKAVKEKIIIREEKIISSAIKVSDNEFVIAGYSTEDVDEKIKNKGLTDFWIAEINKNGEFISQNLFGSYEYDKARVIKRTTDGGYVVAGFSVDDILILKLNHSCKLEWKKTIGGSSIDDAYDIIQTSDEGFILVGASKSNDGDLEDNLGAFDYLVVKLNKNGKLEWVRNFGGSIDDFARSVVELEDGYLIVGYTYSGDWDITNRIGEADIWVVRIDKDGNLIWERTYGGKYDDKAYSIIKANDSGFIISGITRSSYENLNKKKVMGEQDIYILKIDKNGNVIWDKTFGKPGTDGFSAITLDKNGYIVSGYRFKVDKIVETETIEPDDGPIFYGHDIIWIFRIDNEGNLVNETFFDEGQDARVPVVIPTTDDNGYLIFENIYEVGMFHYFIIKLSDDFIEEWRKK